MGFWICGKTDSKPSNSVIQQKLSSQASELESRIRETESNLLFLNAEISQLVIKLKLEDSQAVKQAIGARLAQRFARKKVLLGELERDSAVLAIVEKAANSTSQVRKNSAAKAALKVVAQGFREAARDQTRPQEEKKAKVLEEDPTDYPRGSLNAM